MKQLLLEYIEKLEKYQSAIASREKAEFDLTKARYDYTQIRDSLRNKEVEMLYGAKIGVANCRLCGGTGEIEIGEFDDYRRVKCECKL